MNKRCDRKGFTTVELVIVIAVIATLATVLIPTFSNLVDKANESAALQEANSILKSYFIDNADDTTAARNFYIRAKGYYFRVIDGTLQKNADTTAPTEGNAVIVSSIANEPYYKVEQIAESAPEDGEEQEPTSKCNCYDGTDDKEHYCDICKEHIHDVTSYNEAMGWCLFCKP